MKKLNLAIIGQGRSGMQIHGAFYRTEDNVYFNVKYVVDADEGRRNMAKDLYPGCETLADYKELFGKKDIDVVVNASYSYMHFPITKDLLEHGFNVLVEKPFARNRYECETLINLAKEKGVTLAVFQQTFYAPFYQDALKVMNEKKVGDLEQISIHYNGMARRWDWQTLQKKMGGNAYNTGPHPIGMALGFLGFDEQTKVVYSRMRTTPFSSGDSDDYCKIILEAPGKPVVDIEINNTDAYSDFNVKFQGDYGTFKNNPFNYKCKYVIPGENVERPVQEEFLHDENNNPLYCSEKLITHEEEGNYNGTAFDVGTRELYKELYYKLTENKPMTIVPEMVAKIIEVIETAHAQNPLKLKY